MVAALSTAFGARLIAPVALLMTNALPVLPERMENTTLDLSPVVATVPTAEAAAAESAMEKTWLAVTLGATSVNATETV